LETGKVYNLVWLKIVMKREEAWFALGCFWNPELRFSQISGVVSTKVGYSGGVKKNPGYEEVCTGKTGHVETVKIIYDSTKITYDELLQVFWSSHDPTQINRQGHDIGSQYRSVIFYHSPEQKMKAEKSLKNEQKKISKKIVTEIVPATNFYEAEEYHQNYLKKKGVDSCSL